jgi:hypothetical protein
MQAASALRIAGNLFVTTQFVLFPSIHSFRRTITTVLSKSSSPILFLHLNQNGNLPRGNAALLLPHFETPSGVPRSNSRLRYLRNVSDRQRGIGSGQEQKELQSSALNARRLRRNK